MNNNQTNNKSNQVPINEQIRFPKVIVIDDAGENLGEMPTKQALEMASKKDLDLVLIAKKRRLM